MLSLLTLALASAAFGQTAPEPTPKVDDPKQVYVLSVFKVETKASSEYQGLAANSAGRIATALIDTPQAISVVTREFMDDVGTNRLLDAMKYSASVTESNFPNRLGRITLRGFQQDAAQQSFFIDGFRYSAISAGYNADASNLERLEIVKGPNAIIGAAGSPGGSINSVTVSPKFEQAGSLSVGFGEYLSNRAVLDVTGPLALFGGNKVAYRLVVMDTDAKGYQQNEFKKALLVDPSFTVRFSPETEVTVKGHFSKSDQSVMNLPLSPLVGPADPLALYPGIPRTWSGTSGSKPSNPGTESRLIMEGTHRFTDAFQVRLGTMLSDLTNNSLQDGGVGGITTQSGNINPNTGLYTPGTNWTVFNYGLPTQAVTQSAVNFPDFTNRTTGFSFPINRQFNRDYLFAVQNDWVFTKEFSKDVSSTTVAGASYFRHKYNWHSYAGKSVPLVGTVENPDYATMVPQLAALSLLKNGLGSEIENTRQWFVADVVKLFGDRAFLNASISHMNYAQELAPDSITTNKYGGAAAIPVSLPDWVGGTYKPAPGFNTLHGSKTNLSYGLLVKPVKNISVYGTHSSNTNPPTLNAFPNLNQYGTMDEFGVKGEFLDGRITQTLDYFSINQYNVSVYNINTDTFIQLGQTRSKGWEYEVNGHLTKEFSLIGAYSDMKVRNAADQRLRMAPDRSGSVAVKYKFTSGSLNGLWFMLGAGYSGQVAGENPPSINIDKASAAAGVVEQGNTLLKYAGRTLTGAPVNASFFLPARTIFDLTGGYTYNKQWKFWFKVANLTDKNYIAAALSRGTLTPGAPRNFSAAVTYKF